MSQTSKEELYLMKSQLLTSHIKWNARPRLDQEVQPIQLNIRIKWVVLINNWTPSIIRHREICNFLQISTEDLNYQYWWNHKVNNQNSRLFKRPQSTTRELHATNSNARSEKVLLEKYIEFITNRPRKYMLWNESAKYPRQ